MREPNAASGHSVLCSAALVVCCTTGGRPDSVGPPAFLGRFLPKLGGASRCRPFFTYAGRARGAPLSHGSQNGVNRMYDFVPCSSGHLAVAMGSVGQLGKGAYGLSVAPRCSRLQNFAKARAPVGVPLMGMRS